MKLSKKSQLEERIRELEEDLRYEKHVSDSLEQSAWDAVEIGGMYNMLAEDLIRFLGLDPSTTSAPQLFAVAKEKLAELNDMKIRIRRFVWEMK